MTAEEAQAYERFLDEAQSEPVKYIKHDTQAHDDEALYRLANTYGMAYYGLYWLLVELLTGRRHHYYDVGDEAGWRRLTSDMGCLCDMSQEECMTFVKRLYDADLINRQWFDEMHRVSIKRINADAFVYAETVATKKLGAWKTNRRRLDG